MRLFSIQLISSLIFKSLMLLTIAIHTILYINSPKKINIQIKNLFIFTYIFEAFLKIFAEGIKGYFKIGWNTIDFTIIILNNLSSNNYSPIRVVRLLRILPLKQLQLMIDSLIKIIPSILRLCLTILVFAASFAIVGFNAFHNYLKKRCLLTSFGIIPKENYMLCGNVSCPEKFCCSYSFFEKNPDSGLTSFDDFFHSLIQIFRIITLENWSSLQNKFQITFSNFSWIFFVPLAIFGNFFLLRLIKAVIKVKFSNTLNKFQEEGIEEISQVEQRKKVLKNSWRNKIIQNKNAQFKGLFKKNFLIKKKKFNSVFFKKVDFQFKKINFGVYGKKKRKFNSFEKISRIIIGKKNLFSIVKNYESKFTKFFNSFFKILFCEINQNENDFTENFFSEVDSKIEYESENLFDVLPNKYLIHI